MVVWKITMLRRLRQLFGRSIDWRDMPVDNRNPGRDLLAPPSISFFVTVPRKEFKLTKAEWEALIAPYRGGVDTNVGF